MLHSYEQLRYLNRNPEPQHHFESSAAETYKETERIRNRSRLQSFTEMIKCCLYIRLRAMASEAASVADFLSPSAIIISSKVQPATGILTHRWLFKEQCFRYSVFVSEINKIPACPTQILHNLVFRNS